MPAFGTIQTHGVLLKWLKRERDAVAKGEPLMEVETDKATVEVEAPAAGIIGSIAAREGQAVAVGKLIGWIVDPGEAIPDKDDRDQPIEQALQGGTGSASATRVETSAESPKQNFEAMESGRILASPAARRLAKEQGIELRNIRGSGPHGSIRTIDLPASNNSPGVIIPLSAMRRIVGERMSHSKQTAPHFYLSVDIDMSAVMRRRDQLKSAGGVLIPSINDFIVAASATALKAFPQLNASLAGNAIKLHQEINIGLAVALDDGLVVPVIPTTDKLTLDELARESRELILRAQNKKLLPHGYEGGTFTVSNLGMLGVDSFIAIINPPQAAILATGKVAPRVIVEEDALAIRPIMTATLSVDHRVTDGATAARFLQCVKRELELPVEKRG